MSGLRPYRDGYGKVFARHGVSPCWCVPSTPGKTKVGAPGRAEPRLTRSGPPIQTPTTSSRYRRNRDLRFEVTHREPSSSRPEHISQMTVAPPDMSHDTGLSKYGHCPKKGHAPRPRHQQCHYQRSNSRFCPNGALFWTLLPLLSNKRLTWQEASSPSGSLAEKETL